jgi:hypothetical protein
MVSPTPPEQRFPPPEIVAVGVEAAKLKPGVVSPKKQKRINLKIRVLFLFMTKSAELNVESMG